MGLHQAIRQATLEGWHLEYVLGKEAGFSYQPTSGSDTGWHVFNIFLTFISCGAWLAVYIPLMIIDALRDVSPQAMTLIEDEFGHVTQIRGKS